MSGRSTPDDGPASVLEDAETVTAASPRPLGVALLVAGIVHLLAPGALLSLAERGYDRVLAVEFDPGETTPRRVRVLGVGMVLAGGHLLYHGGVRPGPSGS